MGGMGGVRRVNEYRIVTSPCGVEVVGTNHSPLARSPVQAKARRTDRVG